MSAPDPLFDLDEAGLAALRDARFAATLDRIFAAHPHYRRRFAAAGLRREHIRGLADLARLPVTTKADYMAEPDAFRLGPEGAAEPEETVVWDSMYTTGSSGSPTPFVSTGYDFLNILALQRNMLRLRGVTADDSILNLFPLTRHPHGAFARAMNAAAAFGIPVTAALPGQVSPRQPGIGHRLDEVVAIAARTRATILWGVPSYLRKLAARAEDLGATLPATRLLFVTGEGFGEDARADLLDRLRRLGAPDPRVSVSYGSTEMQGGMVECTAGSGYHNPSPDQFLFEAVDPDTHAPVPDGEEGLVLLTHLDRRGTVMLRYALGDVARLTRARCPHCGALTERLTSIPHRVDGLVKIKGMLVNPQALVDALMAEPALAEFQAVVDKDVPGDPLSMDRLVLHAVPTAAPDPDTARRVADRVRRACGVTPTVQWTTPADTLLAGRGWKAKPLLDLRTP
ncbi:phenylacetate--CoA ligase family protein [Roseomonas sp. BN140053]|uniref:phenylacetate--CoA ligase family protein n=1 Tax=Roseomonas sp. BN140053 TaxID=3391898 RepID=UPI0039ECBDBD